MRVLRAKAVRKTLKFFKIIFGISPPYHVLLDGNFIFTAMKYKLDIRHRLESLLQESSFKIYVLQSSIDELRSVGEKAEEALEWTLRCCEAIDDSVYQNSDPVMRVVKVVENAAKGVGKSKRHFFVASQDKDVRQSAGAIPGTPIIYLNKVTLVLEPPSAASLNYRNTAEDIKTSVGREESTILNRMNNRTPKEAAAPQPVVEATSSAVREVDFVMRPKKKAAKAPNPLSQRKASDSSNATKKKKAAKYRRSA